MKLYKKSQAELITTILLILISIAAVVLVSGFIINMVRTNLVNTDCFKTTGQLKINLEEGYTFYNTTVTKAVYISLSRGESDANITGILISIGNGQTSNSYKISKGSSSPTGVTMYDGSGVVIPGKSETRTYKIISNTTISKVKVVPILGSDITCKEGADEQTIPSRAA